MRRRGARAAAAAVALVLMAAAAACGTTADLTTGAEQEATWSRRVLPGAPGADAAVEVVERDGTTLVLSSSEGGDLQVWRAEGRDAFDEPVTATAEEAVQLSAAASGEQRLVAVAAPSGDDSSFIPVVFTSQDGREWAPAADAFDAPSDVAEVVATEDGYVALGNRRDPDDPALGGFEPAIWRSANGLNWEAGQLPAGEGHVAGAAEVDGLLVAVGESDGETVLWRSGDGGAIWSQTDLGLDVGGPIGLSGLSASGGTLIAAGSTEPTDTGEERALVLRSTDQGATWAEAVLPDALAADLGHLTVLGGPEQGFWLLGDRGVDAFADPDRCYADLSACAGSSAPVLLHSGDGEAWEQVDLSDLGGAELLQVFAVSLTAEGDTVVVGADEEGLASWTWPFGQGDLPVATAAPGGAEAPDTPLAEYGGDLEEGTTYRYPLYLHCGIDQLGEFNGQLWVLDEAAGETPETGAGDEVPESWPVAQQTLFGELTLVSDEQIEYTLPDGELVATYAPTDEEPTGCA